MATTICKIAEQLNIAPSTVSRALKKPQLVSLETRDKVLQAAMKLGYLKQLRDNCAIANIPEKNSLIGVIVADLSTTFANKIVKAIYDFLDENNYSAIVGSHYENSSIETKLLKQWSALNLSGLIVVPTQKFSQTLNNCYKSTPIVCVDRALEDINCDCVTEDNQYGMEQAVEYLHKLGHQKIAVISGSSSVFTFKQRVEGALKADKNIEVIEIKGQTYDELYMGSFEACNNLCIRKNFTRPTAIIGANNAITSGILYAQNLQKISLGSGMSVISYGDNHWCRFFPTPISVIVQPIEEIGRNACQILLDKIEGKTSKVVRQALKPMFLPRASTCNLGSN